MNEILKQFVERQRNSVEYSRAGMWPVYSGCYELAEQEVEGERHKCVVRSNYDEGKVWWYSPFREPLLFIEFAELFDRMVPDEEAAPIVLDWVERHGALGANYALSEMEERRMASATREGMRFRVTRGTIDVDHPYPVSDSSRYHDADRIQWVSEFVGHSVIANGCWQVLAAAKAPEASLARKRRGRGRPTKREQRMVDNLIDMYLRSETYMCRYRLGDGTSVRGPGFHSLLGAMYLQMSNFRDALRGDITFCEWCGNPVTFELGESLPSHAPKGARGKHKPHRNRRFCKEKYGVKDYCKNKFNYQRRKKAKEAS